MWRWRQTQSPRHAEQMLCSRSTLALGDLADSLQLPAPHLCFLWCPPELLSTLCLETNKPSDVAPLIQQPRGLEPPGSGSCICTQYTPASRPRLFYNPMTDVLSPLQEKLGPEQEESELEPSQTKHPGIKKINMGEKEREGVERKGEGDCLNL